MDDNATRSERVLRVDLPTSGQSPVRASTQSINAALGVAAVAAAGIPVVGSIIAAILAAIAAIIVLIGTILAKAKEEEAAEKEKQDSGDPKLHRLP